jgi:putative spermidine/putrescine transport system ATP-binding protein/spermidine/putrescine transport system ATP-binding protein
VFQNYALFPHMNVEKNVGYGLRMRGVPKAEITERVRNALDLVKLAGFGERRPRELSGGQQQRVALARALVIRPKVLLLDEPFSALDKNLRGSMQVELKDIQRRLGVTTIFVTHDQGEALSMSDRIVVMSEGRVRQIGTPDEVYRRPKDRFVAAFVGDVNVLKGRIESSGGERATVAIGAMRRIVTAGAIADCAAGRQVDVFVRPEHLRLSEPGGAGALPARVTAIIYQGGHVDVHAELGSGGRVLARIAGHEALGAYTVGAEVGVVLPPADLVAFPSEAEPSS